MRTIVSNTGPLLHLHEIEALSLLRLAGSVAIPIQVKKELALLEPEFILPEWILVESLDEMFAIEVERWQQAELLDSGEANALGLVRQQRADWFLTDDAAARLVATSLEIKVHGSLGIVLWAAVEKHLTFAQANVLLEKLAQSSLWVSWRVLAEAKLALTEIFKNVASE
ncbi:MAG: hypothetical protein HDKAJFGB_04204 [Anaerolineae bacterium]|nr:hypothetical protein [Anaerolineae bacterium]